MLNVAVKKRIVLRQEITSTKVASVHSRCRLRPLRSRIQPILRRRRHERACCRLEDCNGDLKGRADCRTKKKRWCPAFSRFPIFCFVSKMKCEYNVVFCALLHFLFFFIIVLFFNVLPLNKYSSFLLLLVYHVDSGRRNGIISHIYQSTCENDPRSDRCTTNA